MVKGVLYNPYKDDEPRVITMEEDFRVLRDAIDCRCFDITTRKFGNVICDIVCDDEGLMVEQPRAVVHNDDGTFIAGAVFITGEADDDGYLTSLTTEQCNTILNMFKRRDIITPDSIYPSWSIYGKYYWED